MARKIALVFVVVLLAVVVWAVFFENNSMTIVINGQQVTGPLEGVIGVGGMIVALIAFFCAATLLMFVFAGVGVVVLGLLLLGGLILAASASPVLLVLTVPVAIVWLVVALSRSGA